MSCSPSSRDVVGDDPGLGIYVGALGKGVEAAGNEAAPREPSPLASGSRLL